MTTKTWNGVAADWSVAADWTPNGAPGTADDVAIAAGTVSVTTHTGLIHTLGVSGGGLLAFIGGAMVVSGAITNSAILNVDKAADQGGSNLFGDAALNNSGTINIGNDTLSAPTLVAPITFANFIGSTNGTINITGGTTNQAKFEVGGQAAGFGVTGVLQGTVSLKGNALFQFDSGGQIATIADGSSLTLNGASAFLADAGSTASNSALTGLATIIGSLDLENGAQVSTGALTNNILGAINLDQSGGVGGSSLTINGKLTNSNQISLGNASQTHPDSITATSLDNTGGGITLTGNATGVNYATLAINSAAGIGAANILQGNVTLNNESLLAFSSGQITTIAALSNLTLNGPHAFLADIGSTTSNSALAGLDTINGTLDLENIGASSMPNTSGALTNSGALHVDVLDSAGGSHWTIGGALTNGGSLSLGNTGVASLASILMAASIDNTGGTISVVGGGGGAPPVSTLSFAGTAGFGAAGHLKGAVTLTGAAQIVFTGGGQITDIDAGGSLTLAGSNAFLANAPNPSSNSALADLATINGALRLTASDGGGPGVTTNGALTNNGTITLDSYPASSSLTIGGVLTNTGTIILSGGSRGSMSATGLVNSGTITLESHAIATFQIIGAASNSGTVTVGPITTFSATTYTQTAGSTIVAGTFDTSVALSGGAFSIEKTALGSYVTGDVTFTGAATLKLGDTEASMMGGTIRGFGVGDTIDLTNVAYAAGERMVLQSRTDAIQTFALEDASNAVIETLQLGAPGVALPYYINQIFSVADDGAGKAAITLTQAPVAPPPPTLTLTHDTGSSASDLITSNPAIAYSQPPSGYTQMYKLDAGTFSATQPTIATDGMADGQHTVSVEQLDTAGDVIFVASKTFTLDTKAPVLNIQSFSGTTRSATQTILGTIDQPDAGLSVSVYSGSTLIGTATPSGGGIWKPSVTFPHVGANVILAKATDAAGNSATSGSITLTLTPKLGDLNGDGCADIFFRHTADGVAYLFTMNGPTVTNGTTLSTQVGNNWQVKGVGDFDGDGTTDLLWSYSNAAKAADTFNGISYLTTQNGPAATAGSGVVQQLGAEWSVQGVGDFTGDGKADVLYRRSTDGALYLDVMNGAAINYAASGFTSTQLADPHWHVAGVADFNGDGKADILWRYDNASDAADPLNGALYEWTMNGKTVASQASLSAQPGSDHWTVAGTGDFNGDGKADILLRYENAANAADALNGLTYLDQMNGATVISSAPTQWQIDNSWAIASIGDYNGDGMSDILFQQASTGNTYIWQMNGSSVTSGDLTSKQSGAGWTVQNGVLIA